MSGRPPLDLRVYLVTDTGMTARHGLDATVRAAVRGGATLVQLRDPDCSDAELVALGRLVRGALRGTGIPLVINDRAHLVEEIGADGAHVGQGDLHPTQARRLLGPTAYLGLSCSTLDEVRAAGELPEGTLDYLGVGPVRATPSKPDHARPVGLDGVRALAAASPVPCVAIGGLSAADAPSLVAGGLAGMAVVSAVCAADDPQEAAASLRSAWEEAQPWT